MNVLITGATGLVATELTVKLLAESDYSLILLSRNPTELAQRYRAHAGRIKCMTLDELLGSDDCDVDVCVHTAFARSADGGDIAESLNYLTKLVGRLKRSKLTRFINISSQSVYGNDYQPPAAELAPVRPGYLYAMAKFSTELICAQAFENTGIKVVNVRLSSVCENARFMRIFVQNLLEGKPIVVTAPAQTVSFIDVRDVASALKRVIEVSDAVGTYNLGSGQYYSIKHVAEIICEMAARHYSVSLPELIIDDKGTCTSIGMDITKFSRTFDWRPVYSLENMVDSLFSMLTDVKSGGGRIPLSFIIVYRLCQDLSKS